MNKYSVVVENLGSFTAADPDAAFRIVKEVSEGVGRADGEVIYVFEGLNEVYFYAPPVPNHTHVAYINDRMVVHAQRYGLPVE